MTGKHWQPFAGRFPCLLYPPVQHIFIEIQIRRNMAYQFLMFFSQRYRLSFELRAAHQPFLVFLFIFFPLLLYFPLIFVSINWGKVQFKYTPARHSVKHV
jgi:hypothetical protein